MGKKTTNQSPEQFPYNKKDIVTGDFKRQSFKRLNIGPKKRVTLWDLLIFTPENYSLKDYATLHIDIYSTYQIIMKFRKDGLLEDALDLAEKILKPKANSNLYKQAVAWIYYDYLKLYANPNSFKHFKKFLKKINHLQLSKHNQMIFDSCAWQIGNLVLQLMKMPSIDYKKINALFTEIKSFHFSKPSKAYSFLYIAFHQGYKNWSRYLDFADWWGFENFSPDDYLSKDSGGIKFTPLIVQAYLAYSKKLVENETKKLPPRLKTLNKERIHSFLPNLDVLIDKFPQQKTLLYYKAKLLLCLADDENPLKAILPFLKEYRNEYWIWGLLASHFSHDKDLQFACYCKALSLKTPETHLLKIRQSFAEMLLERKMFREAKFEIEKIISICHQHGWQLPLQVTQWAQHEWYRSTTPAKDNQTLYAQFLYKAEHLLSPDQPEETVVVEFINKHKHVIYFVKNKEKFGRFKYHNPAFHLSVGDVINVRFQGKPRNGLYKVLTVRRAELSSKCDAIKKFKGTLKIISPKNNAIAGDVLITPKLIKLHNLSDGQLVKGTAILSFNKLINKWIWKAIEINNSN